MKNELDIVCDVAEKLDQLDIDYMLTGSVAMNYYAEPRMTRDIDVVVELNADSVQRLVERFQADYYISEEAAVDSLSYHGMFNAIHNETVIKVDFVIRKPETYRRVEFDRREVVTFNEHPVAIVSKEDLILSKLVWGKASESERQAADVRNLIASEPDLDYLFRWADTLGVRDQLDHALKGIQDG